MAVVEFSNHRLLNGQACRYLASSKKSIYNLGKMDKHSAQASYLCDPQTRADGFMDCVIA